MKASFTRPPSFGHSRRASVFRDPQRVHLNRPGTPARAFIAKFVTATDLGNSVMHESGAGNLGLGTLAPITKLDIRATHALNIQGATPILSFLDTRVAAGRFKIQAYNGGARFPAHLCFGCLNPRTPRNSSLDSNRMTDFSVLRQRMVDNQIRTREVTDRDVIAAFLSVPRERFAAPDEVPFAYADRELRMAAGAPNRRMMDPVRLARLVHALRRGTDIKAMVVGCGSGYSAAILSQLVGSVVAVEEDEALAALARENLAAVGAGSVSVVEAKLTEGHPPGGPYDAILIDGAVETVPEAILSQLGPGGALAAIERDGGVSRAMLFERVGKDTTKWPLFDAWATPLPGFERRREFVF